DTGQDEPKRRQKIAGLLGEGTRLIWVVRLHGPRCVEVHMPNAPVRLARMGEVLEAPGILRNPVPVSALYDPQEAKRLALRNLLQAEGYENLQAVKDEGHHQGLEQGLEQGLDKGRIVEARVSLRRVLARRKLSLSTENDARIEQCTDREMLERWLDVAVDASTIEQVFG
ncbi:MAG TPA: hypothetical protein PK156_03220, partial [Polyangium sp.]|nr:hypothetical protein [Polyangium sp.]